MSKYIGSIILEGAAQAEDTVITGTSSNGRRVIAEATLQDMGVENRNRRIYEKKDLEPEINGPRMRELIAAKQFYGHAGHPLSNDLVVQQTIDPSKSSVSFLKVWIDGNKIKGHYKGTNNALGEALDLDLRDGCKPAFSLRALGSIDNVGGKAYVRNIKVITWDQVIFPSHRCAYTEKLVTESAGLIQDPMYESQIVVPENDPGTIIRLTDSDARTVLNRLQRESANVTTIVETFEGLYDRIDVIGKNKIAMTSRFGETIHVNLENHVDNVIMDYCFKM